MHHEHRIDRTGASQSLTEVEADGAQPSLLLRVFDHWKLFAAVFATILLSVLLLLALLPKTYLATGSVIVAEPETGLSLPPAGWAQKVGDPADVESQLLVIKSTRMMQKLAEQPKVLDILRRECGMGTMSRDTDCSNLNSESPELLDYLQQRYSVDGAGRSRVITISYKSGSPEIARDMANALINTFLADHLTGLSSGRDVAATEIRSQLVALDKEIGTLDNKIEAFRRERGLTRGSQAPISSEQLSSIAQQLSMAQADRAKAQSDLREAESDLGRAVPTSPLLLSNLSISGIRQQIMAITAEEQALSSSLGPRHPRIRTLTQQARYLRERLSAEIQIVINGARTQLATVEARIAGIERQMANARAEVSRAAADESSIEQLVRDVEVKRRQYAERSEQLNTLVTEQQATLGSTRLVSLASLPVRAFFPKTLPFVVGGLMLATILAVGAALVVDPLLALVRRLRGGRTRSLAILAKLPPLHDAADPAGFQVLHRQVADDRRFRKGLAAVLDAIEGTKPTRRSKGIVVTSLFPGENSAFFALALAKFAAEKGRKVLLVEAQFHDPRLAYLLGLRASQPSFSGFLSRPGGSLERLPVAYDGFDVVVAGSVQPHQGELLSGSGMTSFLRWAERYDLVLFDSPPIAGHMETALLARDMSGVLLCGHEAMMTSPVATDTSARLQRLGVEILGLCLWDEATLPAAREDAAAERRRLRFAS
jgi:uncharacterized protein involved in exopolysaccharide biosynthesis/Mrp family chromosome partitioning ATPase